ncbi:MAG: ABC transporter ATP-binding protein [Pseudomonadota bacterium]
MLEVRNISRCYGEKKAVDRVSFAIDKQQVVGLLGPNGAGKSTIMKIISGSLEATSGEVWYDGARVDRDFSGLQSELGYLPEALPVYPDLLVADYLDYVATIKSVPAGERSDVIGDVLSALNLRTRALDRIGILSRGMKQRVGVAQAIMNRPRLLILDEPTNGLDPEQTEEMRKLIRRLARRATVLLSTHILQEVEAVCDRVIVLHEGKLVLDDSVASLRKCGALWLRVEGKIKQLKASLEQLPHVHHVEHNTKGTCEEFTLRLEMPADVDAVSDQVFHAVAQSGAKLYQMERLSRDLDTVFRESTAGREMEP